MHSDGFIREVDEELQRDRITALWKRYGTIVVSVAVLVVAATAGKAAWDVWQVRQLEHQGAAFAAAEAALRRDDHADAAERFAALASAQSGEAATVGRLKEAQARLAGGDLDQGLALLDAAASSSRVDPALRSFAAISAAQRRLGSADPNELKAILEPHTVAGAPFRHVARELFALATLESGDLDGAVTALRGLEADPLAPGDLRRRAADLLATLGVPSEDELPEAPTTDEAS